MVLVHVLSVERFRTPWKDASSFLVRSTLDPGHFLLTKQESQGEDLLVCESYRTAYYPAMINYKGLLLAALLSSTTATFFGDEDSGGDPAEGPTLGDIFLAAANNYTDAKPVFEKQASINAQLVAEELVEFSDEFRDMCDANGYVESENTYHSDDLNGGYFYSNIYCRVKSSVFDTFVAAVRTMLDGATDPAYDISMSTYSGYSTPAVYLAQKKGLENMLRAADTIEEVMLIMPSWQNLVSYGSPSIVDTAVVAINLNPKYVGGDDTSTSSNVTQRVGMLKRSERIPPPGGR
jgi:hypothetical protein